MASSDNIYRASRLQAARYNPRLASREKAAEQLHFSAESLDDYENGRTVPPCYRVEIMVEVYGDPDLRRLHILGECPLMDEHMTAGPSELAFAACGWGAMLGGLDEMTRRFLEMARDGRINPHEVETAAEVRARAVAVSQLMQETIAAIDKGMAAIQKGGEHP